MQNTTIDKILIVGSGTMGRRIAYQSALYGKKITLFDIDKNALKEAMEKISSWLYEKVDTDKAKKTLSRISIETDLKKGLQPVQMIIENVPENLELKRKVFRQMDELAPENIIFSTNSSSLKPSDIASATNRPEYILNVNFNNPVEDENLVEVMYHKQTLPRVVAAMETFLKEIKCVPVTTHKEITGYSFNRIWRAIKKENLHMVGNGYSHFEDLDRAWILQFNTPYGPFGLMDNIGLDVVRDIEMVYYKESGDERDKPPAFLNEMIQAGYLGAKTGKGFYNYPNPAYQQPGWLNKELPWSEDMKIDLNQRK